MTLSASVGLTACASDSPFVPVPPEDVAITLSVSGGFAGVEYTIEVDGAAGAVRGVSCVAICDFEAGQVLAALSREQVEALSRRLDQTGVMGLDGQDFGLECCDDFHFELTYARGDESSRVRGGGANYPQDLAVAVGLIHGLKEGRVPVLVAQSTQDTDWPRDAYQLGGVEAPRLALNALLTYSGGCEQHRMDLVLWGGWMESFPVQINALITHDDGDDPCDGVVTEERRFDLIPLREAYEDAYGAIGSTPTTVILRLWDPLSSHHPLGRLVEVSL
jgi:hypothetical protein